MLKQLRYGGGSERRGGEKIFDHSWLRTCSSATAAYWCLCVRDVEVDVTTVVAAPTTFVFFL
ncbi:hypothetical protein IC582_020734 [Cucumis melo]